MVSSSLVTNLASSINVSIRQIQKKLLKSSVVTVATLSTEVKALQEGQIVKTHMEIEKKSTCFSPFHIQFSRLFFSS
jgi:hypothetical protein